MKLISKISALMLIFACVYAVSAQDEKQKNDKSRSKTKIGFKYDKKKNLTTVRLKEFRISQLILEKQSSRDIPLHQADLEISYDYQGKEAAEPVDGISLRFRVSSSNYVFLRPQAVMAVLDNDDEGKGRALMLGDSDYKSAAPKFNTVYEEFMAVRIPSEALKKMAAARSLELYLGPVSYRLTDEQIEAVRDLAALLPAAGSGS